MARWALISSEKGQGRASFTLGVVAELRAAGLHVAGFVQRPRTDGDEKGYELQRLATGERIVLAQGGVAAKGPSQESFCTYAFRNDAFELAFGWIRQDAAAAEVLVLEDVSKLEVQGKGHAASLAWALEQPGKVVLISVRASQLFYVVETFGLEGDPVATAELPISDADRAAFVSSIAGLSPGSLRPAPHSALRIQHFR